MRGEQPGGDGVAGFVGGDEVAFVVGVVDGVTQADVDEQAGGVDVGAGHGGRAAADGVDERFVEQVFDHGGGVAGGQGGQRVAAVGVVQVGLVGFAGQEVVDEGAAAGLGGAFEGEAAVEAAGSGQGGVEGFSPVRRRDQQDVGLAGDGFGQLAVGGQEQVGGAAQGAGEALPAGGGVKGLHLDEQFVDVGRGGLGHARLHHPAGRAGRGGRAGRAGRAGPGEAGGQGLAAGPAGGRAGRGGGGAGGEVAAGGAERVEFFDEADRAAFAAGGSA